MLTPQEWTAGLLTGAEIEPLRTRPWADVWRVEAADGRWWLKVNKELTVYEPRLLAALATTGSSLLAESLVHASMPWTLIRDAGAPVRERFAGAEPAEIVAFWCTLLPAYGELQRVTPVPALRAAGLPDLTPDRLLDAFDALVADRRWFTTTANPELGPAELGRIVGSRDALAAAAAELAGGVPATIQHDDLHDGNVFVDVDGRCRIIDWGDAVLSHPFSTLRVTIDVLAYALELPADAPELVRVRDAYLEPWLAAGESRGDLLSQCELAVRTGGLIRALGWARALGTPEAGAELGFSDGPSGWLQRLADDLG
ncbi:phosphotransferase [Microlunatus ginsengisoli]|uniref:Phosphotransferase n=1 Tax=Microlunatus ginsengisoli TaxID=363863 RepID=A0ABP6ZDA7_9ACTN